MKRYGAALIVTFAVSTAPASAFAQEIDFSGQ
jgi:hypothetical protein